MTEQNSTIQLSALKADVAELSNQVDNLEGLYAEFSEMVTTNEAGLSEHVGNLYTLLADISERLNRLEKKLDGRTNYISRIFGY